MEVGGFGGFEAAGVVGEPWVVDDVAEGFAADFALADAGVAIDAGAEIGFGVVEVEGEDLVEADEGIDFRDGGLPTLGSADIVSGLEKMGGIETEAEAFGALDAVVDFGEV